MGTACSSTPNYRSYKKNPHLVRELKTGRIFLKTIHKVELQFYGYLSEVWKVQDKETYALYSLHERKKSDLIENQASYSLVTRENKVISGLSNDFILKVHVTFQEELSLYAMTEYVVGRLSYYINQNYIFSVDELRFIAASLILGLEYLASKNILHRGLKPENIYLTREGKIKIGGFLYAREYVNGMNNSLDCIGSSGYMAPEIIEKQQHCRHADLYGLGIVLYEIATHKRLFEDDTNEETLLKMATFRVNKAAVSAKYSEDFIDLLNKLLQFRPRKRIGAGSFDELKSHAWFGDFDWEGLQEGKKMPHFVPTFEERSIAIHVKKKVNYQLVRRPSKQRLFTGYQSGLINIDSVKTRASDNDIV